MKKITVFLAIALLVSISVLFSGCQKLLDYAAKQPGSPSKQLIPSCSIQKIIFQPYDYPFFPIDTLTIAYNAAGNPISAIRKETSENEPNYYFHYDSQDRLTDLIGVFDNGFYRCWHRFVYDVSGRIAVDSIYDYPEEEDGHPITGWLGTLGTADYLYDSAGRISRVTTNPIDPGDMTIVDNYAYDSTGNLSGYTYDSNVNIHQANKVWQFLSRDYSLNNQVSGSTLSISYQYNSYGLPTQADATTGSLNLIVTDKGDGFSFNHGTISYSCQP